MTEQPNGSGWLLAIDTSTEQASLALTNGTAIAEVSWVAGRNQTVSVLTQIDALLTLAGAEVANLRAVAVATGPGMFNGLRVGMSLAKGFHLGQDAALIGVSTLDITADQFRAFGFPVVAIVAAGRGRLVWQHFPGESGPVNGDVETLCSSLAAQTETVVVAGDLTQEQASRISLLKNVIIPSAMGRLRRPGLLAEIGWRRLMAGEVDEPVSLAPVYVHSSGVPAQG